jgi:DNA-binding HxlR family transcriptional regulator
MLRYFGVRYRTLQGGTFLVGTNKSVLEASPSRSDCTAVTETLSRIGDKWTVLVIANLALEQPLRYTELRRRVEGISQRMLTLTLKGLEADGLITRTMYSTIPPRVEYALAPLGEKLVPPLKTLYEWAVTYRPDILKAREAFAARQ